MICDQTEALNAVMHQISISVDRVKTKCPNSHSYSEGHLPRPPSVLRLHSLSRRERAPAPALRPPARSIIVSALREARLRVAVMLASTPLSLSFSPFVAVATVALALCLSHLWRRPSRPRMEGEGTGARQPTDSRLPHCLPPSLPCCSFLPRSRGAKERRDLFELPSSLLPSRYPHRRTPPPLPTPPPPAVSLSPCPWLSLSLSLSGGEAKWLLGRRHADRGMAGTREGRGRRREGKEGYAKVRRTRGRNFPSFSSPLLPSPFSLPSFIVATARPRRLRPRVRTSMTSPK